MGLRNIFKYLATQAAKAAVCMHKHFIVLNHKCVCWILLKATKKKKKTKKKNRFVLSIDVSPK